MDKDDFKKLLDGALEPIRQDLRDVKKDLQGVKGDLQDVKETQESRVLPSVITTETTIIAYADAYKTNKTNIERLDRRLTTLEDIADIIPPSEFIIHR